MTESIIHVTVYHYTVLGAVNTLTYTALLIVPVAEPALDAVMIQ